MSRRLRACSIVTRAQPPAAEGVPFLLCCPVALLSVVPRWASVVVADGHRRRVWAAGMQGPVIGVIGHHDAVDPQLIDQPGRIFRSGQLRCAAAAGPWCPGSAGEQDTDRGQVRQDLVLADVAISRPSGLWPGGAGGRGGTGKRACRWTRPIPAAARTARRPAARIAGTVVPPARPGRAARSAAGRR